jgi:hypothetical protein
VLKSETDFTALLGKIQIGFMRGSFFIAQGTGGYVTAVTLPKHQFMVQWSDGE